MNELNEKLKFDPKRRRVKNCPCGKSNKDGKFVPFIGYDDKGYCHSCGKTFLPERISVQNNRITKQQLQNMAKSKIDFIPKHKFIELLELGRAFFHQNHFIQWMVNPLRGEFAFDHETVCTVIERYFIGNSTDNQYYGWVLFPYIDHQGNITEVKAMDYDPLTGKRIKEPYSKCMFIGKRLISVSETGINIERCFYGEHLLRGNDKPVKIFESEATATYASAFFDDYVCIATGGKYGVKWFNQNRMKALSGREITLYPDLDAHADWEDLAKELRSNEINARVSNLLFDNAKIYSEIKKIDFQDLVRQKFDLRDILQYQKLTDFKRLKSISLIPKQQNAIPATIQDNGINWDNRIMELELYFENMKFKNQSIRLSGHETIIDLPKFIEASLLTVKAKNGNPKFMPYLIRLEYLKKILSVEKGSEN